MPGFLFHLSYMVKSLLKLFNTGNTRPIPKLAQDHLRDIDLVITLLEDKTGSFHAWL